MSSPASLPDVSLDYADLVSAQRAYFLSGATRPVAWRRAQLEALKALLKDNRGRFYSALYDDLRRNEVDADLMDIGHCINEADYALKHMESWLRPEHLPTPLALRPGRIRVRHDPLGVTLIIGAWNEPLMLTFGPLAPALAAGNTAVIKPSELAVATSALIAELVPRYLDRQAVAVVEGAVPETTALLEQQWDFIFFTGSPRVGKIIHQAAAKHLTPAVLELGGKNPPLVHSSADIKVAAWRIANMRFANGGQICTAPDHVLVWPEVKDELVEHLVQAVRDFYGEEPQQSPDYGRIVNRASAERLAGLLGSGRAVVGGVSISTTSTSRRRCSSTSAGIRRSCRRRCSARSCRSWKSAPSGGLSTGSTATRRRLPSTSSPTTQRQTQHQQRPGHRPVLRPDLTPPPVWPSFRQGPARARRPAMGKIRQPCPDHPESRRND